MNFLNNHNAYGVIKMTKLHRTLCDVVWCHKDVSTDPHCITREKLALYDYLNQFCGAICMFSRFVSNFSVYRIIWKPIRYVQNRCYLKMSEISNIACRRVKTMPEILKPRPLHVHGNFVFGVCKL